jgi:hypothetical protein
VNVPTLEGTAGAVFRVSREQNRIHVAAEGTGKPWRLLLVNAFAAGSSVSGGSAEAGERGLLVTPERATSALTINLAS